MGNASTTGAAGGGAEGMTGNAKIIMGVELFLLFVVLILVLWLAFRKSGWTPTQEAAVVNALSDITCDCKDCVKQVAIDNFKNKFVRKVKWRWTANQVLACIGNRFGKMGITPPVSCDQDIMTILNDMLTAENCRRSPIIL